MDMGKIHEQFSTEADCMRYLEEIRWKGEPTCPYCRSNRATPLQKQPRYHCNNCNTAYSVTVGTVFHRTRLPLQKWFLAIHLILNSRRDISARQLAKRLGVNRNTAWYLSVRVREAMIEPSQRDLLHNIA